MKKNFKLYTVILSIGVLTGCAPDMDGDFQAEKGTADFSTYIAVGNSLTAGYADGGLYLEGQQVAFPNLIAEQLASVGGGEFTSPFFSSEQENGSGYLQLIALDQGNPVTEPVTDKLALRGQNDQGGPLYTKHLEPIQNLGVPGMRLDLAMVPGVGSTLGNPFFERLLPDEVASATRYIDFAAGHDHTFFSFWLGNNDVLGYATNGAVSRPDDPTTRLISVPEFEGAYRTFIEALTVKSQKGVVATIPDVTAVPFFNTVTTALLNAAVEEASGGQANTVYIATKTGAREASTDDLFILTFPSDLLAQPNQQGIPYGLHPANPIEDHYVLDSDEVKEVAARVKQLNAKIMEIAEENDLAVADVYAFLNKVKTGYVYNGIAISSAYITGNAFSLDGIHLTPIGNAIVANLFIDAINKQYKADVPKIDITSYRGIKYPNN